MERNEYNEKMREAIFKISAERVTKDPNENLMEKRAALIRNGVWPDDRKITQEYIISLPTPLACIIAANPKNQES